jgi:hypothetical protein
MDWQCRRQYALKLMTSLNFFSMKACLNPPILKELMQIKEIKNLIKILSSISSHFIFYLTTYFSNFSSIISESKNSAYIVRKYKSAEPLKLWTTDKIEEEILQKKRKKNTERKINKRDILKKIYSQTKSNVRSDYKQELKALEPYQSPTFNPINTTVKKRLLEKQSIEKYNSPDGRIEKSSVARGLSKNRLF